MRLINRLPCCGVVIHLSKASQGSQGRQGTVFWEEEKSATKKIRGEEARKGNVQLVKDNDSADVWMEEEESTAQHPSKWNTQCHLDGQQQQRPLPFWYCRGGYLTLLPRSEISPTPIVDFINEIPTWTGNCTLNAAPSDHAGEQLPKIWPIRGAAVQQHHLGLLVILEIIRNASSVQWIADERGKGTILMNGQLRKKTKEWMEWSTCIRLRDKTKRHPLQLF